MRELLEKTEHLTRRAGSQKRKLMTFEGLACVGGWHWLRVCGSRPQIRCTVIVLYGSTFLVNNTEDQLY